MLGYNKEPYLRVGTDGVFENRRSPATYLNASRKGAPVPSDADPAKPPVWKRISTEPVARWHDHRIHWMGEQDPPAVRRGPGERHVVIPEWKVAVTHGTTDVVATGRLEWIPGPNPLPWVALIAVLIGALVAASFLPSWGVVLAIAVVLLVVGDAVHSYGLAWATAGSTGVRIGRLFGGSLFNIMLWVVALVSLRPLIRKQDIGLARRHRRTVHRPLRWTARRRRSVPVDGAVRLVGRLSRALVATTIGLGLGVAAASVIVSIGPARCSRRSTTSTRRWRTSSRPPVDG